jgi:hypothetical protein
MPTFRTFWTLLAGLALACGSEPRAPKPPELAAAFPNLALPPDAKLVSRAGGADALQLTLESPADMDLILNYYRSVLSTGNWRLVSDIKNSDGSVALYAEQDGPPMWVRVWKPKGQLATMVQLTGAVAAKDSTKRSK